jgi:Na+-transporting methylmalonyl-CoA/oxaloacetate decarboxylase gamma subunit
MRRVRFLKSTCEQLVIAPFLLWNLQVLALATLARVVQQRVQEPRPARVVQQRVQEQVPVVESVRRREQAPLVQVLVHQHYRQQLQSQCQQELCRLRQHESR